MKIKKACPKCQSTDIVRFDAYGVRNNINTSAFDTVNVNKYICCSCGFVEEWIDKEDLAKITKSKMAIR